MPEQTFRIWRHKLLVLERLSGCDHLSECITQRFILTCAHLAPCIVRCSDYFESMQRWNVAAVTKLLSKFRSDTHWHARDAGQGSGRLTEVSEFGSNPGDLCMLTYKPRNLAAPAPLVVVLHGCTQTSAGYDQGAGWTTLADDFGFSVLLPEQQRANNPNGCFNWFLAEDISRGRGEAESISQMIGRLVRDGAADPKRVYITGLSAGGAMAAAMLATYPEKFAAGAIIAGLPYGCADSVPSALQFMAHAQQKSGPQWGELVRRASPNRDAWPRVSIWHGSADRTVAPSNGAALVKQWLDVHELAGQKPEVDRTKNYHHLSWLRGGRVMVEEYTIIGMGHGTPLSVDASDYPHGETGPFLLEAGIASSLHIVRFFGIESSFGGSVRKSKPRVAPDRAYSTHSHSSQEQSQLQAMHNVQQVIDKALRSAGLVK